MSTVMKKTPGYLYMEYLRVICTLAVIVIHVSGANWFRIDIGSADWIVQTFFNIAGRFSVCVFCMISGALLLRSDKQLTVRTLLSRYGVRILICFAVWVVFYAAFYTILYQEDLKYFISRLFKLPDHLWYLLMLIGLYLAHPIIHIVARNRSVTRYLIWLLIALGTLDTVSGITGFFTDMAGGSYGFSLWKSFLGNLDNLKVAFVPGYLGLFLLGSYIHEYGLGRWHKPVVIAAIPALLLSAGLTVWISGVTGKYVYTFMLETNPLIVLASAGIFAFFRNREKALRTEYTRSRITKTIIRIGSYTFGIYLIHFALRDILSQCFSLNAASGPAALTVPLISLLIFVISLLLTALLKAIPGIKRIVS